MQYHSVFSKVRHVSVTRIHFAFPNLLHRCASWPVMQEKRSRACPALVLQAGRAGKGQLRMGQQAWSPSKHRLLGTSKNPRGNGAKGRAESLPLKACDGQESQGEPGHEGGLGGARAAGKKRAKGLRGALARGCAQCYRGQAATPRGTLGAHPGSLESFLPPDTGHEGHLRGAGAAGTWPEWPKGALARGCAVLQRKAKTPWGHSL